MEQKLSNAAKGGLLRQVATFYWNSKNTEDEKRISALVTPTFYKFAPNILYKYRSFDSDGNNLAALLNNLIYFSGPNDNWNDPIDFSISYDLEGDMKGADSQFQIFQARFAARVVYKSLESFGPMFDGLTEKRLYRMALKSIGPSGDIDNGILLNELINFFGNHISENEIALLKSMKVGESGSVFKEGTFQSLKNMFSFNDDMKRSSRFYCMSETPTNPIQWANYADGGKGFCIGYRMDYEDMAKRDFVPGLFPIYYGSRKAIHFDRIVESVLEQLTKSPKSKETNSKLVGDMFASCFTKEKAWQDEEEWRLFVDVSKYKDNLQPFPYATEVYLGQNVSKENKDKLIDVAKKNGMRVFQRKVNVTHSKFIFEEVKIDG